MRRLGLIPCIGAVLALPACIVTHGLGETAEGSTDGSGEGTGAGTGADPDPDPSATSGQPGTDPTDSATGEVPGTTDPSATATDGDTEGETGGETDGNPSCGLDPDYVRWQFNGASSSPLSGVDASFVALLQGDCTVGEITVAVPEVGDPVWSVPLQCALQGRLDGDAEFAGELSPVLEMTGSVDYNEVTQPFISGVRLKLVLDWWGMGWNGWLVLEHPNTGEQLLDLVEAEHVDPYSSTWSRQVGDVFGGPWRSNLSVDVAEDECGGAVGECNDEPRALRIGIGPDWHLLLHEGQEGTMSNQSGSLLYRGSVVAARTNPRPTCTDTPLGSYASAVWIMPQ
jgi:hypothetical protein